MNFKRLFWKRRLCVYKLNYKDFIPAKEREDIDVEIIKEETCDEVLKWRGKNTVKDFKNMIENKEVGIYAKSEGKVEGYTWCTLGKNNPIPQNYFIINENQAMIHYGRICEEERGRGIGPYTLSELIKHVYGEYKIEEFFIYRDKENIASYKSLSKVGFKEYGEYNIYILLGRVINKVKLN